MLLDLSAHGFAQGEPQEGTEVPAILPPGVVGEVTVVPNVVEAETELAVEITAERSGSRAVQQRTLSVMPGEDGLVAEADLHLAPFIDWLAAMKSRIGIPARLGEKGVTRGHLPRLVDIASKDICHQTNPKPCTAADFERIFAGAL